MTNAIDTAQLFKDAHSFARKLMVFRFTEYRAAFSFALKEKWAEAKAKIAALAKRASHDVPFAFDVTAKPLGMTSKAQSFDVTMRDGSVQMVWLPNSAIIKTGTDCMGDQIVRVRGWFWERVKSPELIEAFGCDADAVHASDERAFTVRDGLAHVGRPGRNYSLRRGPVRA